VDSVLYIACVAAVNYSSRFIYVRLLALHLFTVTILWCIYFSIYVAGASRCWRTESPQ